VKRASAAAAGITLLLGGAALTLGATSQAGTTPQRYYLALGDSITYGFQPAKFGLPPSGFDTGYVDVFAARLRALAPGRQLRLPG
jgi:lysophospholipase L1-like esterase